MNSRAKGKRGELEASRLLREHGFDARRGQQFHGGADSPDVVGMPGWHIEVKRVEKGNLYDWMHQASTDCGDNKPVVFHRRNNHPWVVILQAEDFFQLVSEAM